MNPDRDQAAPISRRTVLGGLAGLGLSAAGRGWGDQDNDVLTENTRNPNIIFILSDDHASQALSCYGSTRNQTPGLDRLAAEGMRFENCFCANGICAPSRASILTGCHSHINGVKTNQDVFDGTQQTFPKLFRQAGYQTSLIGKWHLRSAPTGFDHWQVLPGQGDYYNPKMIRDGHEVQTTGYVTDILTDLSLEWLAQRDSDKPFLLMLHHKAPPPELAARTRVS